MQENQKKVRLQGVEENKTERKKRKIYIILPQG